MLIPPDGRFTTHSGHLAPAKTGRPTLRFSGGERRPLQPMVGDPLSNDVYPNSGSWHSPASAGNDRIACGLDVTSLVRGILRDQKSFHAKVQEDVKRPASPLR
jgi:hypothetical protein